VAETDLVVRARRAVVGTDGEVRAVSVTVRDGSVVQISPYDDPAWTPQTASHAGR
jgi:N-acyl-D-aspartate/D-glutamate deacylase